MSTPIFLLAALLTGFVLIAGGWLLNRLLDPLLGLEARLARLNLRRARRLARGEDRYFEELRSIDARLAELEAQAARPRRNWLAMPLVVLLPFVMLFVGILALRLVLPLPRMGEAPRWTDALAPGLFLLIGLRYLLDPASAGLDSVRAARIIGFTLAGISLAVLIPKLI